VVDLPDVLTRQFYLVRHERKYQSPLMQAFQAQLFAD
jgi:DNA-binding transcriptional LysR family regulator